MTGRMRRGPIVIPHSLSQATIFGVRMQAGHKIQEAASLGSVNTSLSWKASIRCHAGATCATSGASKEVYLEVSCASLLRSRAEGRHRRIDQWLAGLIVQITPNRQRRNQFLANLKQHILGKRVFLQISRASKADPTANLGEADFFLPGSAFRWRAAEARCYLYSTCTTRIGELQTTIALGMRGDFALPCRSSWGVRLRFVSLHAYTKDIYFCSHFRARDTRHDTPHTLLQL